MLLITGATGKLGHFIVQGLLNAGVSASELAVLARTPKKAAEFETRGVQVRQGDYSNPESLKAAFEGIARLMFVSSSELGARTPNHEKVIEAAKQAGVRHIVYTSILNADDSPMDLARDHQNTEAALKASGVPFTLLRNGWYFENYTDNLGLALKYNAILGAAEDGRFALATRKDYADAAVKVLLSKHDEQGKVYELGGTPAVTLSELASEVARQSNQPVKYVNLSPSEFEEKLQQFDLPPFVAHLLADADAAAAKGFLDTSSGDLERLLGRPSTSLPEAVRAGLKPR